MRYNLVFDIISNNEKKVKIWVLIWKILGASLLKEVIFYFEFLHF